MTRTGWPDRVKSAKPSAAALPETRLTSLARAGYGLALLCVPGRLITAATGRPASTRARAVTRVLGVRHLAQSAVCAAIPVRGLFAAGAIADGLHAASMLALAGTDAEVRWAVLADAGVEAAFAAAAAGALAGQPRSE
jgi:hypothetical protein